jgi:hypothetical protein
MALVRRISVGGVPVHHEAEAFRLCCATMYGELGQLVARVPAEQRFVCDQQIRGIYCY